MQRATSLQCQQKLAGTGTAATNAEADAETAEDGIAEMVWTAGRRLDGGWTAAGWRSGDGPSVTRLQDRAAAAAAATACTEAFEGVWRRRAKRLAMSRGANKRERERQLEGEESE